MDYASVVNNLCTVTRCFLYIDPKIINIIKNGDFRKSHFLPDHDDCYKLNEDEKRLQNSLSSGCPGGTAAACL